MPREFDCLPSPQQKQVLQTLGFTHAETSYSSTMVEWSGHGISFEVHGKLDLTMCAAAALIIDAARSKGSEEVREPIRKALQFPRNHSF